MRAALVHIGERLRPSDLDEVAASTGTAPVDVVLTSWRASDIAWIILDRTGLPVGVFGVAPSAAPGTGVVWLLGTEGIEREWVAVARQTAEHLKEMHERFLVLWNYIDARNETTIRWLSRAGFHLIDADPAYGREERLFYEFARIAYV